MRKPTGSKRVALRLLRFEQIEQRMLLDAGPVFITEFMANNNHTYLDTTNKYQDWLELYNPTTSAVSLGGWYLTNDPADLTLWQFPAGASIGAGGYMIVIAAGANGLVGGQYYTSFKLPAAGGYVALVQPDGATIASQYDYPEQLADVSYGVPAVSSVLVAPGAAAKTLVPTDSSLQSQFMSPGLDETGWTSGATGVGFDRTTGTPYQSLIATDIYAPMFGQNTSAYVRTPFGFSLANPVASLTLKMKYDDGFVAWLNGTRVASSNASATPAWNSAATADRLSSQGTVFQTFDVTAYRNVLAAGNVLAFQGLNYGSTADFLVLPQLEAAVLNFASPQFFGTPSAGTINTGTAPYGLIEDTKISVDRGFFAAAFDTSITCDTAGATIRYTLDGRTPTAPSGIVTKSISSITRGGVNNTVATVTSAGHGFFTGQQVQIAGASPAHYNGFFNIAVLDANIFTYTMSGAPAGDASGSTTAAMVPAGTVNAKAVSSIARNGTTATATCTGHGFATGQQIQITGAAQWQYNGIFTITSVNANTFTYTMSAAPAAGASGTITAGAVSCLTYTGPVHVATTTTLRAEAFATGYLSSHVDTETYVFLDDVLHQPQIFTDDPTNPFYSANVQYVKNPAFNANNYPSQWINQSNAAAPHSSSTPEGLSQGLYGADYQMDPLVVNDANYAAAIINDLKAIPTLSLVMNPDDWFGNGSTGTNGIKGIYTNPEARDAADTAVPLWERAVSTELITPDGSQGFQINAGIQIHGGGSRVPNKTPKHTFTLQFKNHYDGPLDYPLFGPGAADEFSQIVLRAGYNNSWQHSSSTQRSHGTYLQDKFGQDVLGAMGDLTLHGNFVHLYINGIYWGVYNATEYGDSSFAASYLGGDPSDYDTIKVSETGPVTAPDGDLNAWNAMCAVAVRASTDLRNITTPEGLQDIRKYLDVPAFIDYMIMKFYGADWDWDNHNWIAVRRSRLNGVANDSLGSFKFLNWDGERTLEGVADNRIGTSSLNGPAPGFGPGYLFNQLKTNPEFRLMWADRVHKFLFNGGPLSAAGAAALYATDCQMIDRAIVGESARWGDYHRDVYYGGAMWSAPGYVYTRNNTADPANTRDPNYPGNTADTWVGENNRLFSSYFPARTNNLISQFQGHSPSLYPASATAAPEFSGLPNGGYLTGSLTITKPGGAGTIWYTTDGSDPRVLNVTSWVPATGAPALVKSITLNGTTATVRLPNHGMANGQTVSISGASQPAYNGNFVISNATQDTCTITVAGAPASLATGTIVARPYGISPNGATATVWLPNHGFAAGSRVLMAGADQAYYNGDFLVTSVTANTLTISVNAASVASGAAISLRRIDVRISSIAYNGATATVTTAAAHGFNTGDLVRISGASVATFNGDFSITKISDTKFRYTMSATPSGAASGLMAAARVIAPAAQQYAGPITLTQSSRVKARVLNGTTWSALGDAQFFVNAPAAAGNVAITEINYHPPGPTAAELAVNPGFKTDDFQFIELKNVGQQAIDLTGVQLTFKHLLACTVAPGLATTLAPGASVLIAANPDALAVRYGSGVVSQIAGTFSDELDHGGQRIALCDYRGQVIQDFSYDDSGTWPGRADGKGSTLEVINTSADYNGPDNWRSSIDYNGSPGRAGAAAPLGVVINEVLTRGDAPLSSAVELYNPTASPIALDGWYLTDSLSNCRKFRIPEGTTLGAREYVVFTAEDFGVSLVLDGWNDSKLWLVQADPVSDRLTQFVDNASFWAAKEIESFGRWPNGTGGLYPMVARTFGAANDLGGHGPRIGPLVISEVMYHPPRPAGGQSENDLEYVAISNPTGAAQDMANWKLDGDVGFEFPGGTTLPAGGSLVAVPFDPTSNPDALARFRTRYPGSASAVLLGPFSGKLGNGGGEVQLLRGDAPAGGGTASYPLEDEVRYRDIAPWPIAADGLGSALTRAGVTLWGDGPYSWTAAAPSLGLLGRVPVPGIARYAVAAGSSLTVAAPGVLAGATDPDGRPMTVVLLDGPANGGLALQANGAFSYAPKNGYHGPDSFTYMLTDGLLNSGAATAWINAPIAISINRIGAEVTNAGSVQFTATFSESVTEVDAEDFALALFGTVATGWTVTGSGASYTVRVDGVSGNGTLGLDLADNGTIVNQFGFPLGGPGPGNGDFTGQVYTVLPTLAALDSVAVGRNEGNPGATTDFVFLVTLSAICDQPVEITVDTSDGTAQAAGNDYQAIHGVITFAPGETSKAITVRVNGDARVEANETFGVALSNPLYNGASNPRVALDAARTLAVGMIANDDTTTVSIAPLSAVHPRADSGQVQYTFTVGLSNPSDFTTTVRVDTADRTALASQADYVPITAQTVTVAPSETSQVVAVEVPGKTLLENDKTFAVRLSEVAGSGALPGVSEAIGTILNSHGAIPIGPGGASLLIVSDTADPTGTTANVFFDVDGVQTLVYSVATSGFNQFQVVGGTGRDQVTLDFSHGSPLPSDGLIFEEAAGKTGDSLACIGLTGHVRMSSAGIEVGAAPPAVLRNVSFCGFSFADSSDNRLAIDGVTLAINRDHAISANADVEIVNGGVLDLGGKTDIVKSVTLTDGTIAHGTLQSDLHTLGSGAISAGLTQGSVVKSKPGTAVLSGNNGYAGGTTVLSGVLLAASVAALPQGGAVTIGAGATVVLAPNLNLGTSEAMTTRTVLALPAAESTVTGALPSFCQGLATVPLTTTERHLEARQGVPLRLSAKAGAPRLTSTSAPALAPTRLTPPSKTVGTGASHPVASARAHDLALAARDAERWRDDLAWLAELLQPRGQRRMAHALASPLPVSARS